MMYKLAKNASSTMVSKMICRTVMVASSRIDAFEARPDSSLGKFVSTTPAAKAAVFVAPVALAIPNRVLGVRRRVFRVRVACQHDDMVAVIGLFAWVLDHIGELPRPLAATGTELLVHATPHSLAACCMAACSTRLCSFVPTFTEMSRMKSRPLRV